MPKKQKDGRYRAKVTPAPGEKPVYVSARTLRELNEKKQYVLTHYRDGLKPRDITFQALVVEWFEVIKRPRIRSRSTLQNYLYPRPPSRPQSQVFPPSPASNPPPLPQKKLPESCQQVAGPSPFSPPIKKRGHALCVAAHPLYIHILFPTIRRFPFPALFPRHDLLQIEFLPRRPQRIHHRIAINIKSPLRHLLQGKLPFLCPAIPPQQRLHRTDHNLCRVAQVPLL